MTTGNFQTADQAWRTVLGKLELAVPRHSFETWLESTKGLLLTDNTLTVETTSAFSASYLEERMLPVIESKVRESLSEDYTVTFVVEGQRDLFSHRDDENTRQIKKQSNSSISAANHKLELPVTTLPLM